MARMSLFCSLVSFLISFPFVRLSSASRNNTDDLFPLFLIERMHNQQNRAWPDRSHRYPSLLIFKSEIALCDSVGIIENENSRFKANIVLAKVLPVLVLIPFKSHSWSRLTESIICVSLRQYICTYMCLNRCSQPHHEYRLAGGNSRSAAPGARTLSAKWNALRVRAPVPWQTVIYQECSPHNLFGLPLPGVTSFSRRAK